MDKIDEIAGGTLAKWPKRLTAVPPRISSGTISGVTSQTFNHDNQIWNQRISHYAAYISSIKGSRYRNIMDMNAGLGGFAAALSKYPVWVMNVVPTAKNNTLGVIYERGFIGTYMDWYVHVSQLDYFWQSRTFSLPNNADRSQDLCYFIF